MKNADFNNTTDIQFHQYIDQLSSELAFQALNLDELSLISGGDAAVNMA